MEEDVSREVGFKLCQEVGQEGWPGRRQVQARPGGWPGRRQKQGT